MSDSVASALAGAGGGVASMALTYPLITLSIRSQVSNTEKLTLLETAQKILNDEGLPGLYS
jgi:adenine nucleotide transporter 17